MIGSEPLMKIVCPAQVAAKPDVVRRLGNVTIALRNNTRLIYCQGIYLDAQYFACLLYHAF